MRTDGIVTKFELCRVVALRVLQLTDAACSENPEVVARREILQGTNPVLIRRHLPNKTYEDRKLTDLRLPRDLRRQLLSDLEALEARGAGEGVRSVAQRA